MAKTYEDDETISLECSESRNFNILKTESDLYDEEKNIKLPVINVKRIKLPKNTGEDWEIQNNGETVLVLKGTRFTNAEKEFLRSVDGMKFLISEYKNGTHSVIKFKEKLKKVL